MEEVGRVLESTPAFSMDVMMKSSLELRSLRMVERPYDILVTDPTPGKECTSSASYGLGQIHDKGTKYHSAALTAYGGLEISTEATNNTVWDNEFDRNNGAGAAYDSAHIQAFDDGTCNWWISTERRDNYWAD